MKNNKHNKDITRILNESLINSFDEIFSLNVTIESISSYPYSVINDNLGFYGSTYELKNNNRRFSFYIPNKTSHPLVKLSKNFEYPFDLDTDILKNMVDTINEEYNLTLTNKIMQNLQNSLKLDDVDNITKFTKGDSDSLCGFSDSYKKIGNYYHIREFSFKDDDSIFRIVLKVDDYFVQMFFALNTDEYFIFDTNTEFNKKDLTAFNKDAVYYKYDFDDEKYNKIKPEVENIETQLISNEEANDLLNTYEQTLSKLSKEEQKQLEEEKKLYKKILDSNYEFMLCMETKVNAMQLKLKHEKEKVKKDIEKRIKDEQEIWNKKEEERLNNLEKEFKDEKSKRKKEEEKSTSIIKELAKENDDGLLSQKNIEDLMTGKYKL